MRTSIRIGEVLGQIRAATLYLWWGLLKVRRAPGRTQRSSSLAKVSICAVSYPLLTLNEPNLPTTCFHSKSDLPSILTVSTKPRVSLFRRACPTSLLGRNFEIWTENMKRLTLVLGLLLLVPVFAVVPTLWPSQVQVHSTPRPEPLHAAVRMK